MRLQKQHQTDYIQLKACISQEEHKRLKVIARSRGMTLQGFLAQIVRAELDKKCNKEVG